MEQSAYKYPIKQSTNKKTHVGVAGSGDLKILMFPTEETKSTVKIYTGNDGFGGVWDNVLTRFFDRYPISTDTVINDFDAISEVVYLRLTQAIEELSDEK